MTGSELQHGSGALLLALPSAAALLVLVVHSRFALAPRRALAFWISATAYGVLRGIGVGLVTREGLGAEMPYALHSPLVSLFGVSLQEVVGWTIVLYLAWRIGVRFAAASSSPPAFGKPGSKDPDRRPTGQGDRGPCVFPALAWACLFLGAIGWAVETAAVAASWWHWTVPATHAALLGVPAIGLIDWSFAGTDFLLPFLVLTAPGPRRSRLRGLSLLAFPVHFASHLLTRPIAPWFPVPVFHLVHWGLLAALLLLAFTRRDEDEPARETGRLVRWLPAAALGIVLSDTAIVDALVVRRPGLIVAVLPALAAASLALRPRAGAWIFAGSLGLAAAAPPLALSAVPGAAAWALSSPRARGILARPAVLTLLLGAAMLAVHVPAARRDAAMTSALAEALAARDAGDLARAEGILSGLCRDAPASHAPCALLGEILYRTGRLADARDAYGRAVEIKEDYLDGHRHLAVIGLLLGDRTDALARAEAGLRTAPSDLELRYLRGRARGGADPALRDEAARAAPGACAALAALAFEVGDRDEAALVLEEGLARWPGDARLRALRAKLSGAAAGE